MGNEDGTVVITYNGEVYNFQALRAALEQQGHRFRTRSDTETIVHHYEQHGTGGVAALDGMFAFAIWDGGAGRLVLARDRAGIKPLYYAELPAGGLVFASELTALLAHGGVDRALGAEGLASYFFSDYVQPPHTIVGAVKKLPPGHTLCWERGRLEAPRPFWQVPASGPAPRRGRRDAGAPAVGGDRTRGRGAAHLRRAGGDLPVRGDRLVAGGGGRRAPRAEPRSDEGVLHRVRGRDFRREQLRAHGRRAARRRARHRDAAREEPARRRRSGARQAGRAAGRSLVHPHVSPGAAGRHATSRW